MFFYLEDILHITCSARDMDSKSIDTDVDCAWHRLQVNDGNFTGNLNPVDKLMHEYYPCKFYLCSFPPPHSLTIIEAYL